MSNGNVLVVFKIVSSFSHMSYYVVVLETLKKRLVGTIFFFKKKTFPHGSRKVFKKTVLYKSRKLFLKRVPMGPWAADGGVEAGNVSEACRKRIGSVRKPAWRHHGPRGGHSLPQGPSELEAIKKRFDMKAGNDQTNISSSQPETINKKDVSGKL